MKFRNPFVFANKAESPKRQAGSYKPRFVSAIGREYIQETRMIAGNMMGGNLGVTVGLDSGNVSTKESSWPTWPMTADQVVWRFWNILVARSRECANNNDHGRRFMHLVKDNVVGANGVRLKPLPKGKDGKIDRELADCIRDAWEEYSERPEITQMHDMITRDRNLMQLAAQDGEILCKVVYGKDAGPYGFGIQILDAFLLDPHYNVDGLPNGNYIRAGIEYNDVGRPQAYHLRKTLNEYWGYNTTVEYNRVEARSPSGSPQIIHAFIPELAMQRRGLPWMRTALQRFWHIKGYETASVINARVSAAKLGFFRDPEGDTDPDPMEMDAEPGVFEDIGSREFIKVDWNWPIGEFENFMKSCLRHAASALNVANHSLTGDYSGLNYSSIKAVAEDEQEGWKALQVWFAMSVKRQEYLAWLEYALLAGKIIGPDGRPVRPEMIDRLKRVKWVGRRWSYLDPLKEVSANIQAIIHRLKSRTEVIEENDGDASEVFEQIADEEAELKDLGLDLPQEKGGQQTPNTVNVGSDANGNDDADTEPEGSRVKELEQIADEEAELKELGLDLPQEKGGQQTPNTVNVGSDANGNDDADTEPEDSRVKELEQDLRLMREANRVNATIIAEREMEIASLRAKKTTRKVP